MQSTSYNTNQLPVQIKILTAKKTVNTWSEMGNGGGGWTEWNKMTEICTDVWQIYLYHIYLSANKKDAHKNISKKFWQSFFYAILKCILVVPPVKLVKSNAEIFPIKETYAD